MEVDLVSGTPGRMWEPLHQPMDIDDSLKGTLEVEEPVSQSATTSVAPGQRMDPLVWARRVMARMELERAAKDMYPDVQNRSHGNRLSVEGLRTSHAQLEFKVRTLLREKEQLQEELLETREALARERMQREEERRQAKEQT